MSWTDVEITFKILSSSDLALRYEKDRLEICSFVSSGDFHSAELVLSNDPDCEKKIYGEETHNVLSRIKCCAQCELISRTLKNKFVFFGNEVEIFKTKKNIIRCHHGLKTLGSFLHHVLIGIYLSEKGFPVPKIVTGFTCGEFSYCVQEKLIPLETLPDLEKMIDLCRELPGTIISPKLEDFCYNKFTKKICLRNISKLVLYIGGEFVSREKVKICEPETGVTILSEGSEEWFVPLDKKFVNPNYKTYWIYELLVNLGKFDLIRGITPRDEVITDSLEGKKLLKSLW